jgi:thiol:disulfide interchange protein DsbA
MSLRRIFLVFVIAAGMAACSNSDTSAPQNESAGQQAPAEQTEAPAAAAADGEAAEAQAKATVESVAETEGLADEAASDAGEISFDEPVPAAALAPITYKYQEGDHFRRMTTSQGTSSSPDKIEVAEVFWYGCGHCYNFDPLVDEWKADLAGDVSFVRIPVIWNPTNEVHARAMYTADALGILDEAHDEIFKAIHTQGNQLSSKQGLATFFARLGVENDTFVEAYDSFGVQTATQRAATLTGRYGVRSVPMLIVNGKYAVDGPEVKTFGDMLGIADELVERERRGD